MTNKKLAEAIADKLATYEEHQEEIGSFEAGKQDEAETRDVVTARLIDVAGYNIAFTEETKKEARQAVVDFLLAELDNEKLVLSDAWAEDHL